jgi:hypothetical protein
MYEGVNLIFSNFYFYFYSIANARLRWSIQLLQGDENERLACALAATVSGYAVDWWAES